MKVKKWLTSLIIVLKTLVSRTQEYITPTP